MFERYTEKARRVIFFARYEAMQFGSRYIDTQHLLLGLLREDQMLAHRFLGSDEAVNSIREQIERHTQVREKVSTSVDLPLSQACKQILAYGAEESERLGHKHIGTEHLMIGILREEKSLAAQLLHERGLRLSKVREELTGRPPGDAAPAPVEPALQVASPIRFERFTEKALRAALFACQEANRFGSPTVDIEHLLLGVLREDRLEATRPLRSAEALESIRREIQERTPPDERIPADADLILSRDYQRVLRFASEEAGRLGHEEVETGHLLLGILHEGVGLTTQILPEQGRLLTIVRAELTGS